MISVHRLTHPEHALYLNPDLIQAIEAHPDTVVLLTNATRVVVAEPPERVIDLIRDWRAGIIARALEHHDGTALASTRAIPFADTRGER